jgi:hypothetical protein
MMTEVSAGEELVRGMRAVSKQWLEEYGQRVSRQEIEARTQAALRDYRDARITSFVPVFVLRDVQENST